MSQNSRPDGPAVSRDTCHAFETSVRQLIANGKFKTALENAKEFHKSQRTTASECLLLDAYTARIQSLLDQNLAPEAKSLLDLVRERFPSAKERLDAIEAAASARGGDLARLLQPLNDEKLDSERRAAIEQVVQNQVTDLTAIAGCAALAPDHVLRQAAAALDRALNVVTSGPVTEEQIALPEVSHRSPLAPWKLLIRAIACFHRGEDEACLEFIAAIKPESVPSRLVPVMRAMLGARSNTALKPAETALVSRTSVNLSELRGALTNLDRAFADEENEGRIFKAVRAAVRECQRSVPDRLPELKQRVTVRGGVACLDDDRLRAALEGAARYDAAFFRMYARAMESSGESDEIGEACALWEEFRQHAVREGWFQAKGVEVATLYLHMADILAAMPNELLKDLQRFGVPSHGPAVGPGSEEARYFLYPEKLYARACAIDPHTEAFAQWMHWAARQSVSKAEKVALEWNRILPRDIEPLLYLMEQAGKRSAFPTALSYLEKAERIDAVHSVVRAARLRLLAAGAMRHLQQKKFHLAAEKLATMTALPQSQQGDRPAFLAALRHLICLGSGDKTGAAKALLEVEGQLGNGIASGFLVFGIAAVSKRADMVFLPLVKALSQQERKAIPASLARVMALAKDLGITKFQLPVTYFAEAEAQFPGVSDSLDVEQIRSMGELGMSTEHPELAWAAAHAGLKRGGPAEAHFMLLRARAIPPGFGMRYLAMAAAAAELGRFHRDTDVVDRAVEIVRNPFGGDSVSLTLDQAREVVRKELASPSFPDLYNPGPDYKDLMPGEPCQCPDCRRRRAGEDFELDEDEMERVFNERVPEDIPPDAAKMLFEVMKEAFLAGQTPDEIMSQVMGGRVGGSGGKRKKGRRK